jgi:hypothetical protein
MLQLAPTVSAQERWWTLLRGEGPVLATAIHDGHAVREGLADRFVLSSSERLREEDPFTGFVIQDAPNALIAHRSRFEVDLNRALDSAVYRKPADCWGLQVWKHPLEAGAIQTSRRYHTRFYAELRRVLDQMARDFPRFVVLDVHSYNHRRDGPDAPPTAPEAAPDINIGTFSMPREQWAHVVDPLIEALRSFDFMGRTLDVRENVAFQGKGELARFVHETWPTQGCAIAFEFKKFFMDEWTGEPEPEALDTMRRLINHTTDLLARLA